MSDYLTHLREHMRLIILRALADEPAYTHNDAILTDIAKSFAVDRGRDFVRAEIRWLETIGAVTVRELASALIVTATQRGVDHAQRRLVLDGVRRPSAEG
ncbi:MULTISPECIES: hypothetical protein [Pannonibacter]|jgi:hypothetical protein|uniref:VpaChn25_0724 family phage protein n=1 Tax=Pannonibacter TaxID=227873 RepID=UPI000B95E785|nr:hypothetical protein [Pannonibacter phragmitetus]